MMKFLGSNGIFIFTGVPGRRGPVEVDTDLIMRNLVLKNQVIFGTLNAGRDAFEAAIRDIGIFSQRWSQAVRSLITSRFPTREYRNLLIAPSAGKCNRPRLSGEALSSTRSKRSSRSRRQESGRSGAIGGQPSSVEEGHKVFSSHQLHAVGCAHMAPSFTS